MKQHSSKLNLVVSKLSTPKSISFSLFVFVVVMVLVNVVFKQSFNYLTQTINYTPQYAYDLLNEIGANGRMRHLYVFIPDLIMIISYTALLIGANYKISTNLTKNCTLITILTFMPCILTIIHLSEIVLLLIIILQFPNELLSVVRAASIITLLKSTLTIVFFLIPIVNLCVLAAKKMICRRGS